MENIELPIKKSYVAANSQTAVQDKTSVAGVQQSTEMQLQLDRQKISDEFDQRANAILMSMES